ncbi:2-succinyl-6-hydroxy-2,4-cyclohexadiene-1-carboxylate synthase [Brochothrix thermosphacta]|uniref:2-succinyl-6-hydroxy-2, 4-cyclohexadiene-1-carboxylate synthase n=1 Tax=Brochothrix thermosphacta TaxID=2756 RepID=UPI0003E87B83|nr:2-succinyl-6-hydroxy-2,4-cyclohexadiene-1-carboxylate synthase [Brochothrix thermosphacta]EUJ37043.1 esterase YtxM [Brochothrix thermosphacta DSM 20171 = FSL F6-1036]
MKAYNVKIRSRSYHLLIEGSDELPTILWLHGFTGSSQTFLKTATSIDGFRHVLLDLAGHGQTIATECNYAEQLADIIAIMTQLGSEHFNVVGYSMGGRVALGLACEYPEKVTRLVIESSSPGLATAEERAERRHSDQKLAQRLETNGLEAFIDFWEGIPLFESQRILSTTVKEHLRKQRENNTVVGLQESLYGMGTGSQPSYWDKLSDINCPVTCIVGLLDNKYVSIANAMRLNQPSFEIEGVPDAGHAVHIEKSGYFNNYLKKVFKN